LVCAKALDDRIAVKAMPITSFVFIDNRLPKPDFVKKYSGESRNHMLWFDCHNIGICQHALVHAHTALARAGWNSVHFYSAGRLGMAASRYTKLTSS